MRLFLVQWAEVRPELVGVAATLQAQGHEIVYWLRATSVFLVDAAQFPRTIFHDTADVLAGKPAPGIDDSLFPPLGAGILEELYEAEAVVLLLMNKQYPKASVHERKHIYYEILRYWLGVLRELKPEIILFQYTPHGIADYCVYALAKQLHLPIIMFFGTWVDCRLLSMNDYTKGNLDLPRLLADPAFAPSRAQLTGGLGDYYDKQTNPRIDNTPLYMKSNFSLFSRKKLWRSRLRTLNHSWRDSSLIQTGLQYLRTHFTPNLRDEYRRLQTAPDLEKKFIYVPLHFQPELSTNPLGGTFADQVLMVETLAAALPPYWVIYVKEHPIQWPWYGLWFTGYRYPGYYRAMARLKNVWLIPPETNTFLLTKQAQAVATVTGTAGWEAVLRQKPALVFGLAWYADCPGVWRVHDVASCTAALREIQGGVVPPRSGGDVLRYLCAFDKVTLPGYFDNEARASGTITEEQNSANILALVQAEITKIEQA